MLILDRSLNFIEIESEFPFKESRVPYRVSFDYSNNKIRVYFSNNISNREIINDLIEYEQEDGIDSLYLKYFINRNDNNSEIPEDYNYYKNYGNGREINLEIFKYFIEKEEYIYKRYRERLSDKSKDFNYFDRYAYVLENEHSFYKNITFRMLKNFLIQILDDNCLDILFKNSLLEVFKKQIIYTLNHYKRFGKRFLSDCLDIINFSIKDKLFINNCSEELVNNLKNMKNRFHLKNNYEYYKFMKANINIEGEINDVNNIILSLKLNDKINEMYKMNTLNLKDSSSLDIHENLLNVNKTTNLLLRIYNVGQANLSALYENKDNGQLDQPLVIFDLGSRIKNNKTLNCMLKDIDSNGYVVISHFDCDHYNYYQFKKINKDIFKRKWLIQEPEKYPKEDCLIKLLNKLNKEKTDVYFLDNDIYYGNYIDFNIFKLTQGLIYKMSKYQSTPKNCRSLVSYIEKNNHLYVLPADALYDEFLINSPINNWEFCMVAHHGCEYNSNKSKKITNAFLMCKSPGHGGYCHPSESHLDWLKKYCGTKNIYRFGTNNRVYTNNKIKGKKRTYIPDYYCKSINRDYYDIDIK